MNDKLWLVTEYEVWDAYAGPEEGGWYHTFRKFIKVHYCGSQQDCRKLATTLNEAVVEKKGDYEALGDDETVNGMYPEGYIPRGWIASSSSQFFVGPSDQPLYFDNLKYGLPTYE